MVAIWLPNLDRAFSPASPSDRAKVTAVQDIYAGDPGEAKRR